jgi:hypothetical protein
MSPSTPSQTQRFTVHSLLTTLATLAVAMSWATSGARANAPDAPPAVPSEIAESLAPPPPQPPADPLAPAQLTKRIRVEYATVVYPAFVSWLGTSNGLPNTAATFGMFLTFQAVTPHQRYCYMRCYLEMHG